MSIDIFVIQQMRNTQHHGSGSDDGGGGGGGGQSGNAMFEMGYGLNMPVKDMHEMSLDGGLGTMLQQMVFLNGIFSLSGWPLRPMAITTYFDLGKLGVSSFLNVDISFGLAKGHGGKGR